MLKLYHYMHCFDISEFINFIRFSSPYCVGVRECVHVGRLGAGGGGGGGGYVCGRW